MKDGGDAKVLNYLEEVYLRKSDVHLLNPGLWLNDPIVEFGLLYYLHKFVPSAADRNKVCVVSPATIQLLRFAPELAPSISEDLGWKEKELIVFAINNSSDTEAVGGTHWSLLVYANHTHTFTHLDSLQSSNYKIANQVSSLVHSVLHLPVSIPTDCSCPCVPQQNNSSDCGIYVVCYARALFQCFKAGQPLDVDLSGVSNVVGTERQTLADTIDQLANQS